MSKKVTIGENFAEVIAFLEEHNAPTKMIDFIGDRKAKAEKKNATRKPNKTQVENEGIKAEILDFMEEGKAYTVGEIQKGVGLATNQKTSALLRQLKEVGLIVRSESKGRAYFTKA